MIRRAARRVPMPLAVPLAAAALLAVTGEPAAQTQFSATLAGHAILPAATFVPARRARWRRCAPARILIGEEAAWRERRRPDPRGRPGPVARSSRARHRAVTARC